MKNITKKLLFMGLALVMTLAVTINNNTKPYDRLKSYINILSNQAFADEIVSEADGTKIESTSVSWILEDGSTTKDNIVIKKDDTYTLNIRARVNIALSGKTNYKEGDIKIKIPKTLFDSRYEDVKMHHHFNFSVPKAPDKSQPFSYDEDDDNYIITNTRILPASTQASFELTMSPAPVLAIKDVSSGYYSKPLFATVEVTTNKNNIIKMKSNEIKAGLDTVAKVTST